MCKSGFLNVEYIDNPPVESLVDDRNYFRLYYCQRGHFTSSVNGNEGLFFHGDTFIIPPGVACTITVNIPYTVYFVVLFDEKFISGTEENEFLDYVSKEDNIYPKVSLPPEEIVFYEGAMYKISKEFSERKDDFIKIIRSCIRTLCSILFRTYKNQIQKPLSEFYSKENLIKYCISYTDAHCCENITLSDITKLSAMSRAMFCELFKKETGLPFKDYLNRKRIQKAISLMKGDEKITEIAYMCGYGEFSTFYRNFIKFTGFSPERYRKDNFFRNVSHV